MSIQELFADYKEQYQKMVRMKRHRDPEPETVCPRCRNILHRDVLEKKHYLCNYCGYHFPMPPEARFRLLSDNGKYLEFQRDLASRDPLSFPGYAEKLAEASRKCGGGEAVSTGIVMVRDIPAAAAVMNSAFLMGSMGTVAGEKIAALAEYASAKRLPLVIFTASGGARMQEGMFSLMQMAKTAAAIERYRRNGGFYISWLTDPTTGGVSASFASLGDIMIAEPGALICFAGPRVIEQTIGRTLPEGFQRAEYLLEHGMIDMICERRNLKDTLYRLLKLHTVNGRLRGAEAGPDIR